MVTTAFDPSTHGFKFDNWFEHHVGPITFYGACGGMCYAALDYYHCLVNTPTHREGDFGGLKVPPAESTLARYIWKRQYDSTVGSWHAAKHWELSWNPDDNALFHWSTHDEWQKLKAYIDAGTPIPLGLINFGGAFWTNHQVVAYGYDESGGNKVVHVYDPNHNRQNVTLTLNGKYWRASQGGSDDTDASKRGHWRGWFVESAYQVEGPSYQDFVLISGLEVPSSAMVPEDVGAKFMMKNIGEFTAHADLLAVIDSRSGATMFPSDSNIDVAPGGACQYWRFFKTTTPGSHFLSPAYKAGGEWQVPPPANPGASENAFLKVEGTDPGKLETFITISAQRGHKLAEPTLGKKLNETPGTVPFSAGRPFGITDLQSLVVKYEVTEWTLRATAEVVEGSYGHAASAPRKITWTIGGGAATSSATASQPDSSSFTATLKPKTDGPYKLTATVTGANGKTVSVTRELKLGDTYTDSSALSNAMQRAEQAMEDMLKELHRGNIVIGGLPDPLPGPRGLVVGPRPMIARPRR